MPRDRNILNLSLPRQELPDLTLSFARNVALDLVRLEHVLHVELFGTIASEQHGTDLCFLLVVDDETYDKFVSLCEKYNSELKGKEILSQFPPEVIRRMVLSAIWNIHDPEWERMNDFFRSNVHTDVCVVPEGWRTKKRELKKISTLFGVTYRDSILNEARPIATRRN